MDNPDRQEPTELTQPIGLTRRDFLKLGGAAMLTAAFGPILKEPKREPEIESANKIFFDKDGVLFVNGSRFLPKVLYGLPGDHSALESWERAKTAGANIATMVFPTAEIVALAEQTGMKILARLDYAFPDFIPNQKEFERLEQSAAVVGWEIDEPNQYWRLYQTKTGIPKDQALFELVNWLGAKTKLPLRVITDGRARLMRNPDSRKFLKNLYRTFGRAVIAGPDVYETGARVAEEAADYAKSQQELATATVWQVTGAVSEGDNLTFDEMAYQTVSGIVAGSRGFGFYDSPWNCDAAGCQVGLEGNGEINAFGKHLPDVKKIFDLLEQVKHGLVGIEVHSGRSGSINFRVMRHWAFANRLFVFCCNNDFGEPMPVTGYVDGLPAGANYHDIISKSEVVSSQQGELAVNLGPGQAAVFKVKDSPWRRVLE